MRPVVVFDTNILFSSIGWRGNPYRCIELARTGIVTGITCREILDELIDKLESKLSLTSDVALDAVTDLLSFLKPVPINGTLKVISADPDDDKVLECATVATASHIITGDRRHLIPLGNFQGIQIVTASEFLVLATALP